MTPFARAFANGTPLGHPVLVGPLNLSPRRVQFYLIGEIDCLSTSPRADIHTDDLSRRRYCHGKSAFTFMGQFKLSLDFVASLPFDGLSLYVHAISRTLFVVTFPVCLVI